MAQAHEREGAGEGGGAGAGEGAVQGVGFGLGPDRWIRLRELLDAALALPEHERDAWLAALRGDAAALRPQLRALLSEAASAHLAVLLETLPKVQTDQFAAPPPRDSGAAPGARIGPYRLIRPLGEGGMASVWLAERTDVLQRRQVALKLPHGAWRRAGLAERMAREREILATLEHRHIARLYDAGVADDGQPYLALEVVHGEPIDRWCAQRALGVRERVTLFRQVCDAVAHAHAHLVVHRDIKPSNVLVDAQGQAKLLDFGIAKLIEGDRADETQLTREVGRAMTPDYAAPEQILGKPLGTSADTYALGVVLFELLVGRRPYSLLSEGSGSLEQAIERAEPCRPSDAAVDPVLKRQLAGDLDTIVLKALKKAPEERYATVNAFADDLRRYLANEPVLARPDSALYRLRKLLARHRLAAGATVAVALSLVVGAGVAAWQARLAIAERDRANQVRSFIESIFRDADPYAGAKGPPTVAGLLRTARQRVDRELADQPALRVELLEVIGASLANMGENAEAVKALDAAVGLGRATLGDGDPATLRARVTRLPAYRFQGRGREARAEMEALLPLLRKPGANAEALVNTLLEQSMLASDEGRSADAEAPGVEALRVSRERLGDRHPHTSQAAVQVEQAYEFQRRFREAKTAGELALQLALAAHEDNPRHGDVTTARVALGRVLGELGEYANAIAQVEQAVRDALAQLGGVSLEAGFYRLNLAKLLIAAGDPRRGIDEARAALQILGERAEEGRRFMGAAHARLGTALLGARRTDEAAAVLTKALAEDQAARGAAHPSMRVTREKLALALAQQGHAEQAARLLATDGPLGVQAPAASLGARAAIARAEGDHASAERLARQALATLSKSPSPTVDRMRALPELGLALVGLKRHAEALEMLNEAEALLVRHEVAVSPDRADVWLGQGLALLGLQRTDQALVRMQRAVEFWRDFGADPRWAAEAARGLAQIRP